MFTVLFLVGLTAYGGGPAQSPEVMPTVIRGSAARSGIRSNEAKQISGTPRPARQSSIEKTIWRGQSSSFGIRWTSRNITIAHQSAPSRFLFSAREIAEKEFQAFKKDNVTDARNSLCTYEESFSLLSVVGSIVSYERFEDSYCRDSGGKWAWPHPSDDICYRAIDLKRYSNQVVLSDLFSESEILKAILADPLVAKTIQNHQAASTAKTVAELIRFFEEEGLSLDPKAETARAPKGCTFVFPKNLLDQFAFHHLENGKVAIRLSLEPNVGACRMAHAELGIMLPIPESLKVPLALAQSSKEGFLMKDWKRIGGSKVTRFAFRTGNDEKMRR